MKQLTLEQKDLVYYQDGLELDPFEATRLMYSLIHIHLVSEEANYDTGWYRLVFDLDRSQDTPNFAATHHYV